jgi:hypothetical protein
MGIAYLLEWPGVIEDDYNAVMDDLALSKLPPGGIFHAAGMTDSGLRIVDIWESEDAFNNFFRSKLRKALEDHGLQPPQVSAWPIHNTLR